MEPHIASLDGKEMYHLAHAAQSRLHLDGYRVAPINNFSNFGVDRKVIYCRNETERVATRLEKEFISGPELEPTDRWLIVSMSR
jgi:hypothetical protein